MYGQGPLDYPLRWRMRHLPLLRRHGDAPARWMVVRQVSTEAQADLPLAPGLDVYKHWRPEYQQRALEALRQAENQSWRPFFCPNRTCNGHAHVVPDQQKDCSAINGHVWIEFRGLWACSECSVTGTPVDDWLWEHARSDQRPPAWNTDWTTLLMSGGRGSGKTRTGSEVTHQAAKITSRITLIAATGPDLRETMVEGISGILATAKPGSRPVWEPSRKRLTWPNGCVAQGFSAEEPDRLRGPESGFVWADEPAHYPLAAEVWSNMEFGFRVKDRHGRDPKIIATSTPRPTAWMKELIAEDDTVVRRVASYLNAHNLADVFKRKIFKKHEGTRLGRQELYGELLEDVEGALWTLGIIEHATDAPPDMDRIGVGVDPAGSTDPRADDTGIIVEGVKGEFGYILGDYTGKYTPEQWGRKVWQAVRDHGADVIAVEKNYGGEMCKHVLATTKPHDLDARIEPVNSRRGKVLRAEPVIARYEQKRRFHCGERGDLADLETEMTTWVPLPGSPSPNRIDALVHIDTLLDNGHGKASIASFDKILRRAPVPRHLDRRRTFG